MHSGKLTNDEFEKILKEHLDILGKSKRKYIKTHHNTLPGSPNLPHISISTPKTCREPVQNKNSNVTRNAATQELMAQYTATSLSNYHIFSDEGERQTLNKLLRGDNKDIWWQSLSNKLGRTAQCNDRVNGNDTIDFIPKN